MPWARTWTSVSCKRARSRSGNGTQSSWDHGFPEQPGDSLRMANPYWSWEHRDFDGREGHVEHSWHPLHQDRLRVSGWDKDRVAKVYSEQRAMHTAMKDLTLG